VLRLEDIRPKAAVRTILPDSGLERTPELSDRPLNLPIPETGGIQNDIVNLAGK
jgi:hypothetical protein